MAAILAIGEAKWHETMSIAHVERLRHIRGLPTAQGRHGAATAGSQRLRPMPPAMSFSATVILSGSGSSGRHSGR